MTLRLCYVEGGWAWFTTAPLVGNGRQWGDDWDDAPYEHNAGDPYEWAEYMGERGIPEYDLLRVAWHAPQLEPPCELDHPNSRWSVEQINAEEVAWLTDPMYGSRPRIQRPVLLAGATVDEFVDSIEREGGQVYLPHATLRLERLRTAWWRNLYEDDVCPDDLAGLDAACEDALREQKETSC